MIRTCESLRLMFLIGFSFFVICKVVYTWYVDIYFKINCLFQFSAMFCFDVFLFCFHSCLTYIRHRYDTGTPSVVSVSDGSSAAHKPEDSREPEAADSSLPGGEGTGAAAVAKVFTRRRPRCAVRCSPTKHVRFPW